VKLVKSLLFALLVFVSGVALVPVVGLPASGFNWQRYADVYVPTTLMVNHTSGQPGSFFTITGTNYPPSSVATILVNGVNLGDVATDVDGNLIFVIDTTGSSSGYYTVVANLVPNVFTRFLLNQGEPQWPQDVIAPVFQLPPNIANQLIFTPIIHR